MNIKTFTNEYNQICKVHLAKNSNRPMKNKMNQLCNLGRIPLPRFSGKTKTVYCSCHYSYPQHQHLIEISERGGYKIKFDLA